MTKDRDLDPRVVMARKWSAMTFVGATAGLMAANAVVASDAKHGIDAGMHNAWLVQVSGTEGGEGGEGGGEAVKPDAKVDLLVQMSKIEAHIITGLDLYAAGQTTGAVEQFEVPKSELYGAIEAALGTYQAPSLEPSLETLVQAGQANRNIEDLVAIHAALQGVADDARAAIAPTPKEEFAAVLALAKEAAEDFDAGVKDGAITELGEYQDARAYLLAARETAARLALSDDKVVKKAAEKSAAAIDEVTATLPGVLPQDTVATTLDAFLAASAKIELAIYSVQ